MKRIVRVKQVQLPRDYCCWRHAVQASFYGLMILGGLAWLSVFWHRSQLNQVMRYTTEHWQAGERRWRQVDQRQRENQKTQQLCIQAERLVQQLKPSEASTRGQDTTALWRTGIIEDPSAELLHFTREISLDRKRLSMLTPTSMSMMSLSSAPLSSELRSSDTHATAPHLVDMRIQLTLAVSPRAWDRVLYRLAQHSMGVTLMRWRLERMPRETRYRVQLWLMLTPKQAFPLFERCLSQMRRGIDMVRHSQTLGKADKRQA